MDASLKKALTVLGLDDSTDHPPKMKVVTRRFHELSLLHHPDRPGGDNSRYQVISEAYRFIGDFIEEHYESRIDDPDEEIARQVFRSFNCGDVKENLRSFTININNDSSSIWDNILTKHYGKPSDRTHNNNGKHWKHVGYMDDNMNKGNISIGKWHKPKKDNQSKLNIQSSGSGNFLPAHFVSVHLPKLLAEVKDAAANPRLVHLGNSSSMISCTDCNFKAVCKSQLNLHIKRAHNKSSGHLVFKPPSSFDIPSPFNVLPSTPTLPEPAAFNCFMCSQPYNQGEWDAHEKSAHNLKCTLCDETLITKKDLGEHMKTSHGGQSPKTTSKVDFTVISSVYASDQEEGAHLKHDPAISEEPVAATFRCDLCEFTSKLNRSMKTHIQKQHMDQSVITCDICNHESTSNSTLAEHILNAHMKKNPEVVIHELKSYHCDQCAFTAVNEQTLRDHVKTKHQSLSLECEFCPYTAPLHVNLRRHVAVSHAKVKCDKCNFSSSSEFVLTLHKEQHHNRDSQPPKEQLYPCSLCGITFSQQNDLDSHVTRRHSPPQDGTSPSSPPNPILTMVLEEQIDMAQSLKELKASFDAQMSEIRRDQETLINDMKKLSQDNVLSHESFSKMEKLQCSTYGQLQNIASLISSLSSTSARDDIPLTVPMPNRETPAPPPTAGIPRTSVPILPSSSSSSLEAPEAPANIKKAVPRSEPPSVYSSPSYSKTQSKPRPPTQHLTARLPTSERSKVLFIADNIGSNADIRHLEEATNTMIYIEEAFGAAFKNDAARPYENFIHASMNAPAKHNFKYAVLQGSSSDITDLNTSEASHSNIEFLKQEVHVASQNMISAARHIVLNNPGIEKVLILDRIPRFDLRSADPSQLKSKLSDYGNKVLRDVLSSCDVRAKICVAAHDLPTELQQNLYGHQDRRGYDGIHLHGPDGRNHYSRSLCNIFQRFLSENARESHNHIIPRKKPEPITRNTHPSPPHPMKKQEAVIIDMDTPDDCGFQYQYSVPTFNHYDVLGN